MTRRTDDQPPIQRPTVEVATAADRVALSQVLARAFWDDPVWQWLFPDDVHASRGACELTFRAYLRDAMRVGTVLHHPRAPGRRRCGSRRASGSWRTCRCSRPPPSCCGPSAPGCSPRWRSSGRSRPSTRRDPHWYLAVIGTDPVAQGKGVGGALIRQITDRCDRAGLPAYLESSKDVNVPVLRALRLPGHRRDPARQRRPHHLVHVARSPGPRVGRRPGLRRRHDQPA